MIHLRIMPRLTVTMTDHFQQRLTIYAAQHGASLGGALLALAARGFEADEVDQARVAGRRANSSRRHLASDQ